MAEGKKHNLIALEERIRAKCLAELKMLLGKFHLIKNKDINSLTTEEFNDVIEEAFEKFEINLAEAKLSNNYEVQGKAYSILATIYCYRREYEEAIENYQEYLLIFDQLLQPALDGYEISGRASQLRAIADFIQLNKNDGNVMFENNADYEYGNEVAKNVAQSENNRNIHNIDEMIVSGIEGTNIFNDLLHSAELYVKKGNKYCAAELYNIALNLNEIQFDPIKKLNILKALICIMESVKDPDDDDNVQKLNILQKKYNAILNGGNDELWNKYPYLIDINMKNNDYVKALVNTDKYFTHCKELGTPNETRKILDQIVDIRYKLYLKILTQDEILRKFVLPKDSKLVFKVPKYIVKLDDHRIQKIWVDRNNDAIGLFTSLKIDESLKLHLFNLEWERECLKKEDLHAETIRNIGLCYREKMKYDLAIKYFEIYFKLAKNDERMKTIALYYLEDIYERYLDNLKMCKPRHILTVTGLSLKLKQIMNQRDLIQNKKGFPSYKSSKTRIDLIENSITLYKEMIQEIKCYEINEVSIQIIAHNYYCLGDTYLCLNVYDDAIKNFNAIISDQNLRNDYFVNASLKLYHCYMVTKKYELALKVIEEFFEFAIKINNRTLVDKAFRWNKIVLISLKLYQNIVELAKKYRNYCIKTQYEMGINEAKLDIEKYELVSANQG